jgi:hypothetical protein
VLLLETLQDLVLVAVQLGRRVGGGCEERQARREDGERAPARRAI